SSSVRRSSRRLDQTAPPLEVIVCDDGSTDDVDGTLSPFQDRITLIRQERRGPGAAKPAGARLARGDFVDLLDGDDAYLPTRLEALGELASVGRTLTSCSRTRTSRSAAGRSGRPTTRHGRSRSRISG